jgi:predicted glycosyltransferase/CheY-like chemotaxis protein
MRQRSVLIVEDETIVQLHLERIVEGMGHRVSGTATSVAEALAQAERDPPELVLMDVNLSGDGDGIDAARALARDYDCAVVFATAYGDEATLARTAGLGSGYLVKPFTSVGVRATIQTALAGWQAGTSALPPQATQFARFGAATRMLFYSHDTFGLGHLQRSSNLIRTLVEAHPGLSVLLVTGSPVVDRYQLPSGADYVKLPAVRKVAAERYAARSLRISDAGVRRLRRNLLLGAVQNFDPNVVLVDHAPVGMRGEMRPALDWLTNRGACHRIFGMRDISDDPQVILPLWRKQGIYGVLRELYDDIVIYGDPTVFDPVARYEFPEDIAAKTRFVGYVCEPSPPLRAAPTASSHVPRVAVSIGGGDGAESVIRVFLEMLAAFPDEIDFTTEILTGPLLAPELAQEFRDRAQALPVKIRDYMPSTSVWFSDADLVVSTAGYNTCTQILSHAQRALLIPRVLHRKEQLLRSQRLAELGLVAFVDPRSVTPKSLLHSIRESLDRDDKPLSEARRVGLLPLDGAERFTAFCGELRVVASTEEIE